MCKIISASIAMKEKGDWVMNIDKMQEIMTVSRYLMALTIIFIIL